MLGGLRLSLGFDEDVPANVTSFGQFGTEWYAGGSKASANRN